MVDIIKRHLELLEEESTLPLKRWWLSFVLDDVFQGVVIVDAPGLAAAHHYVTDLGLNLHGQIVGVPIEFEVGDSFCNRILTREEVESLGGVRHGDMKTTHELI